MTLFGPTTIGEIVKTAPIAVVVTRNTKPAIPSGNCTKR
jgi:hypothetical protein